MVKILIDRADTYCGKALVEEFRTLGQISVTYGSQSSGVEGLAVIDSEDTFAMSRAFIENDVIIFDLHSASVKQVEIAAKFLKSEELVGTKVFICISSVMVWGATQPRAVVREDDQEEPQDEDEEPSPMKKLRPYTDQDFNLRKAAGRYQQWKSLETLLISIGMNRSLLKLYVIAAGLQYGLGEQILNYHFQSAWLEDPSNLPYIGQGDNVVPTIHVIDLARSCRFIAENQPPQRYIVAVDCTELPTQKNLIASISTGVGTGKTLSLDSGNFDWTEHLVVNVYLKTSTVLLELPKTDEDEEADEEAEVKVPFNWHCKAGIPANIQLLNQEFVEVRGLVPVKVLLAGPPACGKSLFAGKLSAFYNVPVINVKDVVREVKGAQSDLGNRVREKLQELVDEKQEAAGEDVVIDPESVRLPDDLLAEAFRARLRANQCRNRGYILDGWPRNHTDATNLFFPKLITTDAEGNEVEKEELLNDILPQSLVLFEASDEFLTLRVKALPEVQISGTHFNEIDMERRLSKYRDSNESPTGLPSLQDFMTDNHVESFVISSSEGTIQFQQEALKIFIERNGKPLNYMTIEEHLEKNRHAKFEADEKKRTVKQEFDLEVEEAQEHEKRSKNLSSVSIRLDEIWRKNRDLLEQRAQPTRAYIAEEVLPILSDGLLEACRTLPENPVMFLVEYLFSNSHRVRKPNPSSI